MTIGLSNKRLYNFEMIRFIAFLFLVFISTFSIAQEIESGVIAIASNPVKITNAQGEVRIAKTGDKIYLNDTIQTDAQGKTQILLKDQMTISLGPNSQMVVDKFVYDPKEKSKNELSTQIKQGAFKFISGKIASDNKDAMKVSTPKATIAIRGTGVAGEVQPTGTDTIVLLDGQIGVTSNKNSKITQNISQSGFGVTINPTGIVSSPILIPAVTLNTILNQIAPQTSNSSSTKEQQQIISALSKDLLTSDNLIAKSVGQENAQKFESALIGAANTLAKSNNDRLLVSDLFKIINQNNDLKDIVDSITRANNAFGSYDNVRVDVNILPYFAAGYSPNYMTKEYFYTKTGQVVFDAYNVPMTTSNGGTGSGSGTVNSAIVTVNYDARTFNTSYDLNYVLNAIAYTASGSSTKSITDNIKNGGGTLSGSDRLQDLNLISNATATNGANTSYIDLKFSVGSIGNVADKMASIVVSAKDTNGSPSPSHYIWGIGQSIGKPLE